MNKEKKYKWHKIVDSIDELYFATNNLLQLEIAGKKICLAKAEKLYACIAKCPHAGGTLAEGYLDNLGTITCPLHRYKFDLKNGRNTTGEGYYLKTFPVEITEKGIFIGIEESGIKSWLK